MATKQPNATTTLDDPTAHSGKSADDGKSAQSGEKRSFWETIVAIGAQIPAETWENVPDDASINYKHYLYGAPKKQP